MELNEGMADFGVTFSATWGTVVEGAAVYQRSLDDSAKATQKFNASMSSMNREMEIGKNPARDLGMAYRLLYGELSALTPAQKAQALAVSETLAMHDRAAVAARGLAVANEAADKMTQMLTRSMVLGKDATAEATVMYERQAGSLKGVTEARYQDVLAIARQSDASKAAAAAEIESIRAVEAAQRRQQALASQMPRALRQGGQALQGIGMGMTMGLTVPILGVDAIAVDRAVKYEGLLGDVRMKMQMTRDESKALGDDLVKLTLPTSLGGGNIADTADNLAKIAAIAGQMGVPRADIEQFVGTIDKLGMTTKINLETGTVALGRLFAVMHEAPSEIGHMADALQTLQGKGASSVQEVLDMSLKLSGAAHEVGMHASDVLALSNAFTAIGLPAELAGTAVSTMMVQMEQSVAKGQATLQTFARVSGMSVEQFKEEFRTAPAQAFDHFIEGLARVKAQGGNTIDVLKALGDDNRRMRQVFLQAAGGAGIFTASLDGTRQAIQNGGGAQQAYNDLVQDTDKQFQLILNTLDSFAKQYGNDVVQVIKDSMPVIGDLLKDLDGLMKSFDAQPESMKKVEFEASLLVAALGPGLGLAGSVMKVVGEGAALIKWLQDVKLAASAAAGAEGVEGLIGNLNNLKNLPLPKLPGGRSGNDVENGVAGYVGSRLAGRLGASGAGEVAEIGSGAGAAGLTTWGGGALESGALTTAGEGIAGAAIGAAAVPVLIIGGSAAFFYGLYQAWHEPAQQFYKDVGKWPGSLVPDSQRDMPSVGSGPGLFGYGTPAPFNPFPKIGEQSKAGSGGFDPTGGLHFGTSGAYNPLPSFVTPAMEAATKHLAEAHAKVVKAIKESVDPIVAQHIQMANDAKEARNHPREAGAASLAGYSYSDFVALDTKDKKTILGIYDEIEKKVKGISTEWKTIKAIGESQGFAVTSSTGGAHAGKAHKAGLADDFSVKGHSAAQVDEFIAEMKRRGYTVFDERTNIFHEKQWTGPNIHVEAPASMLDKEGYRANQTVVDQIHAYEIEVRALRDGKLSLKDIEIQRANALMAEKAAEDGVSVATERRLISIKTETERLIENQRAKEKAIGTTGFGIGSFAGDAVKSNADLDRFHTVVSDHLDSVNSKAPLAIQSVSDLTANWLKLSYAEVDAFNKLSANDPLKMEAESAYMAKLATDNATKAMKDHADSVAYAVKQVREMQAAGNEQAKTFRDIDARYKSHKDLSPVEASKAAAQREIDDHPLWTQAQKDTILADAAAKPGLDEYNRLLQEQKDLYDSLTLSAKAAADQKMRESGMSDAQIAEIDRLKTINNLYTQRKEISDQIASSLVGGLMDLTKKTPRDPQLYTARIGYDNALSNLDTAYAGGLHNSDTASAFAHDRKMIQDHLKQVEDAYKGNANTIANSVKKVFADLAHSALEDVSKKLQKNLSDSISKMILGAFLPHSAKNGGSQAGFSIGAAMSAIPGFPGMGPGSKQETSVFNAQVLNVASMNGGIGGGAGGGGGLFGSLLGAALGGATKGGGAGLAIGKSFQALPFHASGGDVFAGQPFIAGDPGPNSELIMPKTGGHVFTASETRAILNKGSGGDGSKHEVHVHIHGEEAVSAFQRNPNVTLKRAVKAAMSHLQSTGGR